MFAFSDALPRRACQSFGPGHSIHWIQARLIGRASDAFVPGRVLDVGATALVVVTDEAVLRLHTHAMTDVARLVERLGWDVIVTPHSALMLPGHGLMSVTAGVPTPCSAPAEAAM